MWGLIPKCLWGQELTYTFWMVRHPADLGMLTVRGWHCLVEAGLVSVDILFYQSINDIFVPISVLMKSLDRGKRSFPRF